MYHQLEIIKHITNTQIEYTEKGIQAKKKKTGVT